jgi:hypothetical protein
MAIRRPRIVLAILGASASLAFWGLAPIAARGPQPVGDFDGLVHACEQALQARLPSSGRLAVVDVPRVEAFGNGGFQLVASFEAPGRGRTSFACEATGRGAAYVVGALTLVQW